METTIEIILTSVHLGSRSVARSGPFELAHATRSATMLGQPKSIARKQHPSCTAEGV